VHRLVGIGLVSLGLVERRLISNMTSLRSLSFIAAVSNVEMRGSRYMYDDARNARVGARHAKIDLRSLPTESEECNSGPSHSHLLQECADIPMWRVSI
jgi:hypothetical protein